MREEVQWGINGVALAHYSSHLMTVRHHVNRCISIPRQPYAKAESEEVEYAVY